MMRLLLLAALLALAPPTTVATDGGVQGEGLPPVFDKRPFVEAKQAASEGKKWLLVKATAEWCGPCRRMDNTTWRDQKVVAWIMANAIAVQVDVDADPGLATTLRIETLPTVVALRDGEHEFDRVVGYRGASDFLAWIEGIAQGRTSLEAVRTLAGSRDGSAGKIDIDARLDLGRSLQEAGRAEEAAEEYAWLWRHMVEHAPSFSGVRSSFMASDMERLAARNEGAKAAFTQLRDETAKTMAEERVAWNELSDWIVLNQIVGDSKRTLTWFDSIRDDARWRPMLIRLSFRLEPLLIQERRWADLGRLYSDPLVKLNDLAKEMKQEAGRAPSLGAFDAEVLKILEEASKDMFRRQAGCLYAALLAAGREQDALTLGRRARELDNAPAMAAALVSTALDAGQARREHIEWLAAGVNSDPSLRVLLKQVQDDLRRQGKK